TRHLASCGGPAHRGRDVLPGADPLLQAPVERIDQCLVAGALPAWLDRVHYVGERDSGFGISEAECTAGAKVTEAPRVRTEGPVRPRGLEAQPERRLPFEHRAPALGLRGRRLGEQVAVEDSDAVDGAAGS